MSVHDSEPQAPRSYGISKSCPPSLDPAPSLHENARSLSPWSRERDDYRDEREDWSHGLRAPHYSLPVCSPSRCGSYAVQAGGRDRGGDKGVALLIAVLMGIAIAVKVLSGS